MFCGNCGAEMKDDDKFCGKCGWSPDAAPAERVATPAAAAVAASASAATAPAYVKPAGPVIGLGAIYRKVFAALAAKPVMLWALSVLCSTVMVIAVVLGGTVPLIGLAAVAILYAGMSVVYLDGYRRLPVNAEQLFEGFKNAGRVAGGMGWMYLWIVLWSCVPLIGPFLAIWKAISYSFTPYILMRNPNVTPLEALKLSMQQTKGHCGTIFLSYLIALLAVGAVFLLLTLIGKACSSSDSWELVIFSTFLKLVFWALYYLTAPLFFGLLISAFYSEIVIDGGASQELAPVAAAAPQAPAAAPQAPAAAPQAPTVAPKAPNAEAQAPTAAPHQ